MIKEKFQVKDPGSALTHCIACILSILAAPPLLIKGWEQGLTHFISLAIFIFSMILLYFASTLYHTLDISDKINQRLRKFDHMAIYILIAGTYTPICLIALDGFIGKLLLALIWLLAIIGIIITAFWVNGPKWVSSIVYIAMGWSCIIAFKPIMDVLSRPAFLWLLIGGIIYTIGGVIYALKIPVFNNRFKHFGGHELFHIFVMGGSFCHYVLIFKYISFMPL